MKKHFVSVWFNLPNGKSYAYNGLVTGKQVGDKLIISFNKLFLTAFGFEMPHHTIISY